MRGGQRITYREEGGFEMVDTASCQGKRSDGVGGGTAMHEGRITRVAFLTQREDMALETMRVVCQHRGAGRA